MIAGQGSGVVIRGLPGETPALARPMRLCEGEAVSPAAHVCLVLVLEVLEQGFSAAHS